MFVVIITRLNHCRLKIFSNQRSDIHNMKFEEIINLKDLNSLKTFTFLIKSDVTFINITQLSKRIYAIKSFNYVVNIIF